MNPSKQVLILGIILLSSYLVWAQDSLCGDATCNGEENCNTCAQDCGTCKALAAGSNVQLTYYWITWEEDYSRNNLNTDLKTCTRQTITTVSSDYADKVRMEGTGKLVDGRMINLGGCGCGSSGYSCFQEIDAAKYPYGMGSRSNALMPFVSVAANDLPYGKTYFVPQFEGMVLPNGRRHNGCIRVDDTGWSFGSNQIDFFAVREKYYDALDNQLNAVRVTIQESSCAIVDYMSNTTQPAASRSPAAPSPSRAPSVPSSAPSTAPSRAPSNAPSQPSTVPVPSSNPTTGDTVCWSNIYSTIPKSGTVTISVRYSATAASTLAVKVVRLSDNAVVGQSSASVTAKSSLLALPVLMNGTVGSGYVIRVSLTPTGQATSASVDYPVSVGLAYQTNASAVQCRSA